MDQTPISPVTRQARLYAKVIYWSDEDNCYIGALPEICGSCCHANTAEDVCRQLQEIAEDYVCDQDDTSLPYSLPAPGHLHFCLSPSESPRPLAY